MGLMTAPRDVQRSRLYRAESHLASSPLPGLEACARYADRVVGTLWWQARFPQHPLADVPRLRPGNGARQAFWRQEADGTHTITLPRRYRTKGVVLHELVHWALSDAHDLPAHGMTFARVLLDATHEFHSSERGDLLAAAYGEHRVRVGAIATTDADGVLRYGADERERLGRVRARSVDAGRLAGIGRARNDRV
jgi:putative metallohydrolase (TIGR04338 family)